MDGTTVGAYPLAGVGSRGGTPTEGNGNAVGGTGPLLIVPDSFGNGSCVAGSGTAVCVATGGAGADVLPPPGTPRVYLARCRFHLHMQVASVHPWGFKHGQHALVAPVPWHVPHATRNLCPPRRPQLLPVVRCQLPHAPIRERRRIRSRALTPVTAAPLHHRQAGGWGQGGQPVRETRWAGYRQRGNSTCPRVRCINGDAHIAPARRRGGGGDDQHRGTTRFPAVGGASGVWHCREKPTAEWAGRWRSPPQGKELPPVEGEQVGGRPQRVQDHVPEPECLPHGGAPRCLPSARRTVGAGRAGDRGATDLVEGLPIAPACPAPHRAG